MKIVCLIKPTPPLLYFVNKINSVYPLTEVIIEKESSSARGISSKLKKHGFLGSYDILRRKISRRKSNADNYNAWFKNKWEALDKSIPFSETASINSEAVCNRINELQPDLILDHGTSIVKDHVVQNAKLALNVHWGLSPYYRGTHCTDWALINWDPYNVGVTVHKLVKEIDGGSILAQSRAEIKPDDTLHSINMQLTYLGTEMILKVIEKLKNGEDLDFKQQDLSLGYLTYLRQWNHQLDKQIQYIEKNNLIEVMLKKPSRDHKLPIINLTY